eukprot:2874143-Amphidinium_carterae.1
MQQTVVGQGGARGRQESGHRSSSSSSSTSSGDASGASHGHGNQVTERKRLSGARAKAKQAHR